LTLKSAPVLLVQVQLAATRTKPQLVTATPEPRSCQTIKTLGSLTLSPSNLTQLGLSNAHPSFTPPPLPQPRPIYA
jgi:hypothetical protein